MFPKLLPLKALFTAQFLSAFVDNMILFIVQGIIIRNGYPIYYLPLVQSMFLFSYIILSPWVGRFADKNPKAHVLIIGNIVKAVGVLLLLIGCNPAISYAVVGIGAVIYSPAKYGILPFLTKDENELLKANSALESYTIVAILAGAIAGGYLADRSIMFALCISILIYGGSIIVSKMIPKDKGNLEISYKNAIREFWADMVILFRNKHSHYSLVGTGSFWLASAVLRMIIFVWVPLTLGICSGTKISMIIAVTGVGIAIGAVITPYFISMNTYYRTIWFGFGMGVCILAFIFITTLPLTIVGLLLIGCLGGIYIVPMNACLQNVGHYLIGAGKTIAVQNFIENTFMFIGVGIYTLATMRNVDVNISLGIVGMVLILVVTYLVVVLKRTSTTQE